MLRKKGALLGQPINHRRFGFRVTVATEVTIAHVVNEDQDDIGSGGKKRQVQKCREDNREERFPLLLPGFLEFRIKHRVLRMHYVGLCISSASSGPKKQQDV